MSEATRTRLREVVLSVLLPLVRTLLRCGVSYTEFAELAKTAFVQAASSDYGVRNRPTNIARVAVMTGLSRKEVSRIRRGASLSISDLTSPITLPAAVLNEWYLNPLYREKSGQPKALSYLGMGNTFSSLVTQVTRDIPPGAVRHELLRAGAMTLTKDNKLLAVKRYYVPNEVDDKAIIGLEVGLRKVAETVAFNTDPDNSTQLRFQRFVEGPLVDAKLIDSVRSDIGRCLTKFSETVAVRLRGKHISSGQQCLEEPKIMRRASVGIYYHETDE